MAGVAERTGVSARQIQYAITHGDLTPEWKVGNSYIFTPEQVGMIKDAAKLVALGIALYLALRAVRAGLVKIDKEEDSAPAQAEREPLSTYDQPSYDTAKDEGKNR
jgi:DNA-binding transcriptional MerR regulator